MRIEVDSLNCIRIYREGESVPFFEQPYYPDTTPWRSREEAEEWGAGYLLWLEDAGLYPEPPLHPESWDSYRTSLAIAKGASNAGN